MRRGEQFPFLTSSFPHVCTAHAAHTHVCTIHMARTRTHSTRSSHTCAHNTYGLHTCTQHTQLTHAHTHTQLTHRDTQHTQLTHVHTQLTHMHTAHTHAHRTCSSHVYTQLTCMCRAHTQLTHVYTAHAAHTCTQHTRLTHVHSTHSSHTAHTAHTHVRTAHTHAHTAHSTHSSHTRAHTHITRRPVNLTFQSLTLYRRLGAFSNTGLQDPQFPQRILRCLEGGGPPQSHWADFQNPRPLGKRRRGSDNCSSLKNKDNLRDDREPPNPPPAGDRGRQRPWDTANGLRRGHSGATVPRSAGRGAVPTVSRRQVHRGAAAGPPLTGSWPPIFNPSGKSEAVPEDLGSEP